MGLLLTYFPPRKGYVYYRSRYGSTVATKYDDASEDVVDEITVRKSGERYVARSEGVGVTSQGRSEEEALSNLLDAIKLYLKDDPGDFDEEELEGSDAPWL
jgi:predicted RNase H-like HicB family nuclease